MSGPAPRDIARWLIRHARARWEMSQPFPLPRYLPETPATGGADPFDPFLPPTVDTLAAATMSADATVACLRLLRPLTASDVHAAQEFYLTWARAKYGAYWRFANLITTLWAATTLIKPTSYLEIGVHRGRSAAVVGAVSPSCAIYGFDRWLSGYAGLPNPGPAFVKRELGAVGHTGDLTLVSGDSRQTLPAFLRAHRELFFDLITIDGDKSVIGVASDFANALPRLKVGGIVVFDDLQAKPPACMGPSDRAGPAVHPVGVRQRHERRRRRHPRDGSRDRLGQLRTRLTRHEPAPSPAARMAGSRRGGSTPLRPAYRSGTRP